MPKKKVDTVREKLKSSIISLLELSDTKSMSEKDVFNKLANNKKIEIVLKKPDGSKSTTYRDAIKELEKEERIYFTPEFGTQKRGGKVYRDILIRMMRLTNKVDIMPDLFSYFGYDETERRFNKKTLKITTKMLLNGYIIALESGSKKFYMRDRKVANFIIDALQNEFFSQHNNRLISALYYISIEAVKRNDMQMIDIIRSFRIKLKNQCIENIPKNMQFVITGLNIFKLVKDRAGLEILKYILENEPNTIYKEITVNGFSEHLANFIRLFPDERNDIFAIKVDNQHQKVKEEVLRALISKIY